MRPITLTVITLSYFDCNKIPRVFILRIFYDMVGRLFLSPPTNQTNNNPPVLNKSNIKSFQKIYFHVFLEKNILNCTQCSINWPKKGVYCVGLIQAHCFHKFCLFIYMLKWRLKLCKNKVFA
jgi:hypothetical protein